MNQGIGKTSLVHALTSTLPILEEDSHVTSPVLEPTEVLSMNADLCVIDTCGYGALLRVKYHTCWCVYIPVLNFNTLCYIFT